MKAWYQSKTVIFGALVSVAGALEQFTPVLTTADGVPGWVLVAVGAVVAVLRSVTSEPLGTGNDEG